jgi:hypothetical protein
MKTDNISYNKERNSIIAEISSKTIAVFDKFTEGKWKFLNYQEGQKEKMLMILNQEVFDALGL